MDQLPRYTSSPSNNELDCFYKDFEEFHNNCCFMCDAFTSIVEGEEILDANAVTGISHFFYWVKHKTQRMKVELNRIQERAELSEE